MNPPKTWRSHAAHGCPSDPANPYWCMDPIDGTKVRQQCKPPHMQPRSFSHALVVHWFQGFVRGEQYAVALAYLIDGVPHLGIVGCPNLACPPAKVDKKGCLFVAVRGQGTTMHALDDSYTGPVTVAEPSDASAMVLCESYEKAHSSHSASSKIAASLGITGEPIRIDSMCKYVANPCLLV